MLLSKLYYLRELHKEKAEVERRLYESFKGERRSMNNQEYLKKLIKELDEEIARVQPVIVKWVEDSDMYYDLKADCIKYFIKGGTRVSLKNKKNFIRDLQHFLYKCWAWHGRTQ